MLVGINSKEETPDAEDSCCEGARYRYHRYRFPVYKIL